MRGGRRPGVAPRPLRYRYSFWFTPLLADLWVGFVGGFQEGEQAENETLAVVIHDPRLQRVVVYYHQKAIKNAF
jgi:hypothetical protein